MCCITPTCIKCGNEIIPEKQITIRGRENECYDCYKQGPKTICIDFDGVLAQYAGWRGPGHMGEPMPGTGGFLQTLKARGYDIVIHTTRPYPGVWDWLVKHNLQGFITGITNTKVPAVAYVDDRAICFNGSFMDLLKDLDQFKPHWKKRCKNCASLIRVQDGGTCVNQHGKNHGMVIEVYPDQGCKNWSDGK